LLILHPDLKKKFSTEPDSFAQIMALKGEVYRQLEGRCTQKFIYEKKAYFIKQHTGVGWKEIFKNLLQFKLPILSAKNEWLAIQRLQELNIAVPEVVGYGCRGINPAARRSFIITRALAENISLEELGQHWRQHPPTFCNKQSLIKEVARIARTLHQYGINHRDFYICHFLLDLSMPSSAGLNLYLIDLHRAGLRKHISMRWVVKDLAALYFSCKKIGLTRRDLLRFIKHYRNKMLPAILKKETLFWRKVEEHGDKLYKQHE
jgi:heptose I phosphotransferase